MTSPYWGFCLSTSQHRFYLVPNAEQLQYFTNTIKEAEERNIISSQSARAILLKAVTYEQYIASSGTPGSLIRDIQTSLENEEPIELGTIATLIAAAGLSTTQAKGLVSATAVFPVDPISMFSIIGASAIIKYAYNRLTATEEITQQITTNDETYYTTLLTALQRRAQAAQTYTDRERKVELEAIQTLYQQYLNEITDDRALQNNRALETTLADTAQAIFPERQERSAAPRFSLEERLGTVSDKLDTLSSLDKPDGCTDCSLFRKNLRDQYTHLFGFILGARLKKSQIMPKALAQPIQLTVMLIQCCKKRCHLPKTSATKALRP